MEKELQITADGSHTLYIPAMDEHYHSVNGALQESRHIFIEAGLHALEKDFIRIVEIGFGTGLNAFLTLKDVELSQAHHIDYQTVRVIPASFRYDSCLELWGADLAGEKRVILSLA